MVAQILLFFLIVTQALAAVAQGGGVRGRVTDAATS